ncbi:MAG: hypothetical protein CML60_09840 [Rhodobacteraceae bacterium]|nr:hypothetical protein [Paracoccaceae bacterium]
MYTTVRKNARKKITALLQDAKAIILTSSSMQIDDSYDSNHRYADVQEVLDWLDDDFNYGDAKLYVDGKGTFHVGGPYHFCDQFKAITDDQELAEHQQWYKLPALNEQPAPAATLPENVISLCDYRKKLAG